MAENKTSGVVVRRPASVGADGEPVHANPAAGDEVELVSTQMLKQILSSRDPENRKGVAEAAQMEADGILVRDPQTGYYEIIGEEELRAIVESGQALPKLSRPADVTESPLHDYADEEHLSLVSVDALRRVLDDDSADGESEPASDDEDEFDPYCS